MKRIILFIWLKVKKLILKTADIMKTNNRIAWIVFGVAIVFILLLTAYMLSLQDEKSIKNQLFNALNIFFTGCTFAGLILTIFFQRKDMKHIIEEQRKQEKRMNQEVFKDDFYKRVTLLKQILSAVSYPVNNNYVQSHTAILYLHDTAIRIIQDIENKKKEIKKNDLQTLHDYGQSLLAWLKTFSLLIDDIFNTPEENAIEKTCYIKILINTLTNIEVSFIYLYCDYLQTEQNINSIRLLLDQGFISTNHITKEFLNDQSRNKFNKLLKIKIFNDPFYSKQVEEALGSDDSRLE